MKFVVGIGNPEKKYDKTRHNVGFAVLELMQDDWAKDKYANALISRFGQEAYLVKPETYVNNTGQTAGTLLEKKKLKSDDFFFICDDVNLDFGKIRLREEGGAGGHHGLESVIEAFGTKKFPRLRIGVKNSEMPQGDLTDFVLGKFNSSEKKELGKILEKAALVCEAWITDGFLAAQNRLSLLQSVKQTRSVEE